MRAMRGCLRICWHRAILMPTVLPAGWRFPTLNECCIACFKWLYGPMSDVAYRQIEHDDHQPLKGK